MTAPVRPGSTLRPGLWKDYYAPDFVVRVDDQVLDPPEQYWRIGPYLIEDETIEQVEKGVWIRFIHRPLSRYVNALAASNLAIARMEEPAPPPGFLARAAEYEEAASIPRLLFLPQLLKQMAARVLFAAALLMRRGSA